MCLTQTKQNIRVYCLENIRFIVLLRFKEGYPHAILPGGTSSRKVLAVMPVVCKSPKRNNWVGTTLILKVDDKLPIYLHLTYFFHSICNCRNNLESDAQWAEVKDFWFKHPGYEPLPLPPSPTTHTHTLKSLVFVFNKGHFIIDRDLFKQF